MNNKQRNLFAALAHYGVSEEENYLTESFAYLLRLLCEKMPHDVLKLINNMTGPLPVHPISDIESVIISTQRSLRTYGRVDLAIEEGDNTLVLVEIKHDSPLGAGQLESYHQYIYEAGKENHGLVLLKRNRDLCFDLNLNIEQFHLVTWYEVHKWLHEIKKADDVSKFLIQEFINFLEEKNMSLKRVSWEYIQGIPALLGLRNMLEVAKNEVMPKLFLRRTQGWSWVGLYIDNNFFFGIRYDKPLIIVYENNFGTAASTSKISMDLEKKHFFSLTSEEQLGVLIDFLKQASQEVKRGSDQAAPPEKENINP